MYDYLLILILATLGLLSHLATTKQWLAWLIRLVIVGVGIWEGTLCIGSCSLFGKPWVAGALSAFTLLILFKPFRQIISWVLTLIESVITIQILGPLFSTKYRTAEYFSKKKIFKPESFPHLVALFVYVSALAVLLMKVEVLPLPEQSLLYNCVGLILLSFCGVGIYINRSYKEACSRLALVRPNKVSTIFGAAIIILTFVFSAIWVVYTHNLGNRDLPTQLAYYNAETFTAAGTFIPSLILALVIAVCAGFGEELLVRGALQPVLGIIPSAVLQGVWHGQLAHAPIFILQVTIWSIFMGLIRRYTNTTATIIGHVGLNIITILLFAINP